jgi:hypothetical protein
MPVMCSVTRTVPPWRGFVLVAAESTNSCLVTRLFCVSVM